MKFLRMGHINRLRIATVVLIGIVFVFTLAFVISASMALHTDYGMTKISRWIGDWLESRATLGLQTITVCDQDKCVTENLSNDIAKGIFENNYAGETCPVSAGNYVIAAQSLILALLIWPMVVLSKPDLVLKWKRASSLFCLSLAFIFALIAVAVWYAMCVSGFNINHCTDMPGCDPMFPFDVRGDVSGAYGFQCIIMIMLFVATVCAFVVQFIPDKFGAGGNVPLINANANQNAGPNYQAF